MLSLFVQYNILGTNTPHLHRAVYMKPIRRTCTSPRWMNADKAVYDAGGNDKSPVCDKTKPAS